MQKMWVVVLWESWAGKGLGMTAWLGQENKQENYRHIRQTGSSFFCSRFGASPEWEDWRICRTWAAQSVLVSRLVVVDVVTVESVSVIKAVAAGTTTVSIIKAVAAGTTLEPHSNEINQEWVIRCLAIQKEWLLLPTWPIGWVLLWTVPTHSPNSMRGFGAPRPIRSLWGPVPLSPVLDPCTGLPTFTPIKATYTAVNASATPGRAIMEVWLGRGFPFRTLAVTGPGAMMFLFVTEAPLRSCTTRQHRFMAAASTTSWATTVATIQKVWEGHQFGHLPAMIAVTIMIIIRREFSNNFLVIFSERPQMPPFGVWIGQVDWRCSNVPNFKCSQQYRACRVYRFIQLMWEKEDVRCSYNVVMQYGVVMSMQHIIQSTEALARKRLQYRSQRRRIGKWIGCRDFYSWTVSILGWKL